ncbi:hypothetical protein [Photobacterium sp. DNB22_13_2]
MNKFTIASVAVATALLAGCGGSSSSGSDKDLPEVPTGGEAEVCFNADAWKAGVHTITEKYEQDEDTYSIDVKSGASFEGMNGLLSIGYSDEYGYDAEYFFVDGKSIFMAGEEWAQIDGDFDKRVYKPAKPMLIFGLNEGESSTTSGSLDRDWDWTNDCEPDEQCIGSETESYDITITFEGFDDVNVDGVSYEACHFTIDDSAESDGVLHQWIDRASGVSIQTAWNDGLPSQQVTKYDIDGVQIFPAAE